MKFFGSGFSGGGEDHRALGDIVAGCEASNHTEYMSHGADTWILMQEAHDRVKGRYALDWHRHSRAARGGSERIPHSGMKIPFAVETNPKTGRRQIRAKRDVPAGFTVWEPEHYETFRSEHAYVEFLQELPLRHLRCEVLSWTHASWMVDDRNDPERQGQYVDVTLDEGAFIGESSDPAAINIDDDCVALRLIKAGEFVSIANYTRPFDASGVAWLDDLRSKAWKRTGLGMGRRRRRRSSSSEEEAAAAAPRRPSSPQDFLQGGVALIALYLLVRVCRGRSTVAKRQQQQQQHASFVSRDRHYAAGDRHRRIAPAARPVSTPRYQSTRQNNQGNHPTNSWRSTDSGSSDSMGSASQKTSLYSQLRKRRTARRLLSPSSSPPQLDFGQFVSLEKTP